MREDTGPLPALLMEGIRSIGLPEAGEIEHWIPLKGECCWRSLAGARPRSSDPESRPCGRLSEGETSSGACTSGQVRERRCWGWPKASGESDGDFRSELDPSWIEPLTESLDSEDDEEVAAVAYVLSLAEGSSGSD